MNCIDCQIAPIDPSLSMHCWICFNKRFDTEECHDECYANNTDETGRGWCGYCIKYRGVSNGHK
jgi:hypothetical protein